MRGRDSGDSAATVPEIHLGLAEAEPERAPACENAVGLDAPIDGGR